MRKLLLVFLCLGASALQAEEAPRGATNCSGCHGAGSSLTLNGWSASDIGAALAAYKGKIRTGTLMPRLASGFTDEELLAIAAWIAAGGMNDDAH